MGLCHCPSQTDIGSSFANFMRNLDGFPHTTEVRCLVFAPPESGVLGHNVAPDIASRIILVPPTPSDVTLAQHIQRLIEDLGASLLRELGAELDSSLAMPTTPVDSSSSADRGPMLRMMLSSMSPRLTGRQLKRKADFQLMSGRTLEAKAGYERAIECLSRTGADVVWHAAALEGASAAQLVHLKQQLLPDAGGDAGGHPASSGGTSRERRPSMLGAAIEGNDAEAIAHFEAYEEALAHARRRLEEGAAMCASRGGRALEVALEIASRLVLRTREVSGAPEP